MDAERLLRHVGDVAGMAGLFYEAAATERKLLSSPQVLCHS
jgi:hypothetical protein